ncbi:hypothetical protein [Actinomadura atramentaria]|uniref:hypothetical protein n=1 Tax=Actinomadura atramentaria TaxID=1990 RepID=UPI00035D6355|nr:hypothetical protein [Actinomadura atramentaria]
MTQHFEKVFDEPEPEPGADPDEFADIEFTTYRATATRSGRAWTATVHDVPTGHPVLVRASTWDELHRTAHRAVVDALGTVDQAVGIDLAPADPDATAALHAVVDTRVARAEAERLEREAVTHAARLLTAQGWTTRDAGAALRLSHQRISHLAPRTK